MAGKSKRTDIQVFEENTAGHDVIIGDVHGEITMLAHLAKELKDNDRLFIVGDLVDRGENSLEVMRFINKFNLQNPPGKIFPIRGNHEVMLLEYIDVCLNSYKYSKEDATEIINNYIIGNGGDWVVDLNEDELKELKGLLVPLPYINYVKAGTDKESFVVVHADMPISDDKLKEKIAAGDLKLSSQEKRHAVWARPQTDEDPFDKNIDRGKEPILAYCGHSILGGMRVKSKHVNLDFGSFQYHHIGMVNHQTKKCFTYTRDKAFNFKAMHIAEQINQQLIAHNPQIKSSSIEDNYKSRSGLLRGDVENFINNPVRTAASDFENKPLAPFDHVKQLLNGMLDFLEVFAEKNPAAKADLAAIKEKIQTQEADFNNYGGLLTKSAWMKLDDNDREKLNRRHFDPAKDSEDILEEMFARDMIQKFIETHVKDKYKFPVTAEDSPALSNMPSLLVDAAFQTILFAATSPDIIDYAQQQTFDEDAFTPELLGRKGHYDMQMLSAEMLKIKLQNPTTQTSVITSAREFMLEHRVKIFSCLDVLNEEKALNKLQQTTAVGESRVELNEAIARAVETVAMSKLKALPSSKLSALQILEHNLAHLNEWKKIVKPLSEKETKYIELVQKSIMEYVLANGSKFEKMKPDDPGLRRVKELSIQLYDALLNPEQNLHSLMKYVDNIMQGKDYHITHFKRASGLDGILGTNLKEARASGLLEEVWAERVLQRDATPIKSK